MMENWLTRSVGISLHKRYSTVISHRYSCLCYIVLITLCSTLLFAEIDIRIENNNFTISDDSTIYNYNRLRLQSDYTYNNFFTTFIGDGINYYNKELIELLSSDTTFKTQTNLKNYGEGRVYAKLYRLYGGWEDDKNRVVVGLQNIQMGVGRIWTPTNIFNPKNSYALEPDETFGVMALAYTRYLNDTSDITLVSSQKADNSFKSALRYKTFLEVADFAIDVISSDDTKMIGYEIEGNLADTGVELRSEGAYINYSDEESAQLIVGADYGFKNGTIVVGEMLYSSDRVSNTLNDNLYMAIAISKQFNIFLDGSITTIISKNRYFIVPALTYSLGDYNSFSLGALLYSEGVEDSYYLRYELSF